VSLIALDGGQGESGGQVLRAALALAAATGQGFTMSRIRERRPRPGLRPDHVAAVRAAALVCGARVNGAFDGSPDLRFEPGPVVGGEFRFELGSTGAVAPVLQLVAPALARAAEPGRLVVTGGTHPPVAPALDYLARHWAAAVEPVGIRCTATLERAGFGPRGGGEARARVEGTGSPSPLALDERGPLVELRGLSGAGKLKGGVAIRQADGARHHLWEAKRLEAKWELVDWKADAPGSFLLLEAVFEKSRAAFGFLGERRVQPDALGERAARRLLHFLDEEEGAVDPFLADQLVVPMALGRGGRVTTPAVSAHLESVVAVVGAFGLPARIWGRHGGPGGVEVSAC
jgi:RNA 3'-terminal phosphate cyclase (ATP)